MEPVSYPREKPGEGALFTDMSDEEVILQLKKNIAAVPYASGVNNHMGSKFMMDERKLSLIFKELKKGACFCGFANVSGYRNFIRCPKNRHKFGERKIFIDNNRNYKEIYNNLINVAQSDDVSPKIIIGHPYPETVRALKAAAEVLRGKRGVELFRYLK